MITALLTLAALLPGEGPLTLEDSKSEPEVRLERVSTAVPWPRGLVFADGELVVLARGRHRRAGGPDPAVQDHAGHLFRVDPSVSEPVVPGVQAGSAVQANGSVAARPTEPVFSLWDPTELPPSRDTRMDRPYCTLAWDARTRNFFICGFSGVDLPDGTFRKNATDSVLRYDMRTAAWSVVDVHDGDAVAVADLGAWVPDDSYPHHDPATHPAPHGWTNGPDGAEVVGRWLYVAAKDNSVLVRYDLGPLVDDPEMGPPDGEPVLGEWVDVRVGDELVRDMHVRGHSALAAHDDQLYVGFRTTSQIVRFPLHPDGTLVQPVVGELVALFDAWDPATGRSHDLMDIAFNGAGELFVSTARAGAVWNVGVPDGHHVFDGREGTGEHPFVSLRELTGNPRARTGNITFDDRDRLYICSGNYDAGNDLAGVIYRAVVD